MRKKILLLAGAVCVAATAAHAAPLGAKSLSERFHLSVNADVKPVKGMMRLAESENSNAIIKPYTERFYLWTGEEWYQVSEAALQYDLKGNIIQFDSRELEEEDDVINRTTTEYDADNRVVSIIESTSVDGGQSWTNYQKKEYQYDDVVTSFRTLVSASLWAGSDWVLNMANSYPITRNDAGAISQVERQVYYMNNFDPTARITNKFDENDPSLVVATRVDEVSSYTLRWEENFDLRDIEWYSTDGQVMNFDLTDFTQGYNRITKATLYYEDEPNAQVSGEYPSDFEATVKFELPDGYMILSRMYTDEALGSYYDSKVLVYEEGGQTYTEEDVISYTMDEYGNVVQIDQASNENGEPVAYGSERYIYRYDDEGRILEVVTTIYDMDEGIYINDIREEYADFKDVAGIDAPEAASAFAWNVQGNILRVKSEAPAEVRVISLDGKTVASAFPATDVTIDLSPLTPGLYIVQTVSPDGAATFKIAVR